MPKPIDPKVRSAAEKAYVSGSATLAEIAKQFGVSDRTVEKWSADDHWETKRANVRKVVEFARPEHVNPRPVRGVSSDGDINPLTLVDEAIYELSGSLAGAIGKDKASISNALRSMLEYREKLRPKTAGEIADQIIALGIAPAEFVAELKARWGARKSA